MKFVSLLSAAALLVASSEAAALDRRQRGGGGDNSQCYSGNDAIDQLINSIPIMSALCASVIPQTTRTTTVTSSTQVTVVATITDTMISPVPGSSTKTNFVTTTGLTTRTVRVTVTASPSAPAPTAPSTSANPPPTVVTPAPTSEAPPPAPTISSAPPAPPAPSSTAPSAPPTPAVPACDAVGYAGSTAAYNFDSSGINGNFVNCSALCRADSKCQSFGYGNNACLLFDVIDTNNVNLVAGSPYRFFNRDCSAPIVSRGLGFSSLFERQFGGGSGWGSSTGTIGQGTGVIQQLTDVCKCIFGNSGGSVVITRTSILGNTVTYKTRATITIPTTVPVTITRTRQTISTILVSTTTYVTAGASTDIPPGTFDGGVGI